MSPSPVLSQRRYQGTGISAGWGVETSASGPFVLIARHSTPYTGFWLYKRENGVLVEKMGGKYTPTLYPPDWGFAYWGQDHDCYYHTDTGVLQIIVSARHAYSSKGAVYFLEWPEDGEDKEDMVELGEIIGDYNNLKLGWSVAIRDDWAMATGETNQVVFFSRSGGTWAKDQRQTYEGCCYVGAQRNGLRLWPHPDGTGVLGVIGQPGYTGGGRVSIVRSLTPGSWEDLVQYDSVTDENSFGSDVDIGIGLGNGSFAATSNKTGWRGVRVFDRVEDDNWTNRGFIKDAYGGSLAGVSVSMGYKVVAFGNHSYKIGGLSYAGALNVAYAETGDWPISQSAQYFEYPSDVQAGEYHTYNRGTRLAYQEGGYIRIIGGSFGYDGVGAIVEYDGDLHFPMNPEVEAPPPEVSGNAIGFTVNVIAGSTFTFPEPDTGSVVNPEDPVSVPESSINLVPANPSIENLWNEFDDHGSLWSLRRKRGEKNWELRRRIRDAAVNLANSSYRGTVNAVTRNLGLSLSKAMSINPKLSASSEFFASDPCVLIQGSYIYLYSDYANSVLDMQINRLTEGGNYERLGGLIDVINGSTYYQAALYGNTSQYMSSACLLNQASRKTVTNEVIPASTKFRLRNLFVIPGSLFFSDRQTFRTEVSHADSVVSTGQYHVDYSQGIVTVYTIPKPPVLARYSYTQYPFLVLSSPIVVQNINDDEFIIELLEQVLQTDGTYANGLPDALGTDIINELLSVFPLYWGDGDTAGPLTKAITSASFIYTPPVEEEEEVDEGTGLEEEDDMPSPRVEYSTTAVVAVELPYAALGNSVNYKLQDGEAYSFAGSETCSLATSGLNGLDTGAEAANTWYHLYLVPSGTALKPIFSATDPDTGPSGYSNFLPIGMVFNDNSSNIAEFDYEEAWFRFRRINDRVRIWNSPVAWDATNDSWYTVDLSTSAGWTLADGADPANFPGFDMAAVDVVELHGLVDEDSNNTLVYVRGGNGVPTETPGYTPIGFPLNGHEFAGLAGAYSQNNNHRIVVPDGKLYFMFRDGAYDIDVAFRIPALRYKYRWG